MKQDKGANRKKFNTGLWFLANPVAMFAGPQPLSMSGNLAMAEFSVKSLALFE